MKNNFLANKFENLDEVEKFLKNTTYQIHRRTRIAEHTIKETLKETKHDF